eukprot:4463456-Pyramimonas_sp.AAC.1
MAARPFARPGPVTHENTVERDLKRAIIAERKLYISVCCTCPECADFGPGCPMGRPSRSPNFENIVGLVSW